MKKVAILQSNYIPWKGYFDIIDKVDLFVFHDDLQYTKGDWRNRNKIKTSRGLEWLTIPCGTSEKRLICDVEIKDTKWQKQHWGKLQTFYKEAEYFSMYCDFFADFYLNNRWTNLSELNQHLIVWIAKNIFRSATDFTDSREYALSSKKSDKVLDILLEAEADYYISGAAAKSYLNEEKLKEEGIRVHWMDYSRYPVYPQYWGSFEHNVSVLDLIFHCGPDSRQYLIQE